MSIFVSNNSNTCCSSNLCHLLPGNLQLLLFNPRTSKVGFIFFFLVLESLGNLSFKFQELDCGKVLIIKIVTFDFPYQATNDDLNWYISHVPRWKWWDRVNPWIFLLSEERQPPHWFSWMTCSSSGSSTGIYDSFINLPESYNCIVIVPEMRGTRADGRILKGIGSWYANFQLRVIWCAVHELQM